MQELSFRETDWQNTAIDKTPPDGLSLQATGEGVNSSTSG